MTCRALAYLGGLLAAGSGLLACKHSEVPPVDTVDTVDTVAPATGDGHTQVAELPAPPRVYRFAWGVDTGEWSRALALAPSGWVVNGTIGELRVHASDDGRVLESTRACNPAHEGLRVFDEHRGVLICDDGKIYALRFPGLTRELVRDLEHRVDAIAWAAERVAIVSSHHRAQLFDVATWERVGQLDVGEDNLLSTLSSDGRSMVVADEAGAVFVHNLDTQDMRASLKVDPRPHAMALSADARQLFIHGHTFEARIYDMQTLEVLDAYESGTWITAAKWISPRQVVATGPDGVHLYARGTVDREPLLDPEVSPPWTTYSALATTSDGGILCAGQSRGRLSCFSAEPMPAAPTAQASSCGPQP